MVNDGTAASAPDDVDISTVNSPPVANAGLDAHVAVGQEVVFDGSGSSDVDGDPLTYSWSFSSVPAGSAAEFDAAGSVTPRFTVDRPGTYVAQLIVFDGVVPSVADTVVITTAPRQLRARGADRDGGGGRASAARRHGVERPRWHAADLRLVVRVTPRGEPRRDRQPDGAHAGLSRRSGRSLRGSARRRRRSAVERSGYGVRLDDQYGARGPGRSDLLDVPVDGLVPLDGSASSDADGQPLSFRWSLLSAPAGSAATLSAATSAMQSFVADRPGDYVAQLIVSDGLVDSTPDTVLVRTANRPPAAGAGRY